jgi:hypothetical protein
MGPLPTLLWRKAIVSEAMSETMFRRKLQSHVGILYSSLGGHSPRYVSHPCISMCACVLSRHVYVRICLIYLCMVSRCVSPCSAVSHCVLTCGLVVPGLLYPCCAKCQCCMLFQARRFNWAQCSSLNVHPLHPPASRICARP